MEEDNRAVLYLRLSKEDKDKLHKGDDSASIQNQKLLLMNYAQEHNYEIVEVYSDDDESGLFDTRPDFERMVKDARLGKFHLVLAKSQSRFSRNMEHIEKYLHHDFPGLGIRFIGVVDGADTAVCENKKSRQINGLVNEWYCEDLSRNIRSAFQAKMRAGKFLGASCPYGYIKDPNDHNHLVPDPYAASIVRRIYSLYLQGYGKAKIAKILTSEGVLIPSQYKREVLGVRYHNAHELDTTKNWSYQTVHGILNNEVYIGNLVQNKCHKISYKDKKHIPQPKENWIRAEHRHEAVIDVSVFEKVRLRQQHRTKTVGGAREDSLFSGLLFCADCNHAMVKTYGKSPGKAFTGYCCKTYKLQGKKQCASHAVKDWQLKETILGSLKEQAKRILTPEEIQKLSVLEKTAVEKKEYDIQICQAEKEIRKNKTYKKESYQNFMDGLLTKEDYLEYTREYEERIAVLLDRIKSLKKQKENQKEKNLALRQWEEAFKNYMDIPKLTRQVVLELIEKIEICADGSVNIYYRFAGRS